LPWAAWGALLFVEDSLHAIWVAAVLSMSCWPLAILMGAAADVHTHQLRRLQASQARSLVHGPLPAARLFCPDYRFAWLCFFVPIPLGVPFKFVAAYLAQVDSPAWLSTGWSHLGWALAWGYGLWLARRADRECPLLLRRFPLRTVLLGAIMACVAIAFKSAWFWQF
jgi:hypothetical protein